MDLRTRPYDHDGVLVAPADGGNGTGVLVLSGSSGRVESERARVLASAGVSAALTYRWFGSPGLPAARVPTALPNASSGYSQIAAGRPGLPNQR